MEDYSENNNESPQENTHEDWEVCMMQLERQVINLLEEGYVNNDIARALSWMLHEIVCEEN